jgi:hypothetical protein
MVKFTVLVDVLGVLKVRLWRQKKNYKEKKKVKNKKECVLIACDLSYLP